MQLLLRAAMLDFWLEVTEVQSVGAKIPTSGRFLVTDG